MKIPLLTLALAVLFSSSAFASNCRDLASRVTWQYRGTNLRIVAHWASGNQYTRYAFDSNYNGKKHVCRFVVTKRDPYYGPGSSCLMLQEPNCADPKKKKGGVWWW